MVEADHFHAEVDAKEPDSSANNQFSKAGTSIEAESGFSKTYSSVDDIEESYLQKKKHTVKVWLTLAAVVGTYVTKQDVFLENLHLELWLRVLSVIL